MENPPKKFFRLSPGTEVRLRYAYFITCKEVVKDAAGKVDRTALHLRSRDQGRQRAGRPQGQGDDPLGVGEGRGRRPRCGVYNPLFAKPDPRGGEDFAADLNPNSLEVLSGARLEPSLAALQLGEPIQFERQGYFCLDRDSAAGKLVFNRTMGLRDSFAKEVAK